MNGPLLYSIIRRCLKTSRAVLHVLFLYLNPNCADWHISILLLFLWLRLYFQPVLLWPQSACSSSWSSCPQVCGQDGHQRQLGVGHSGDQRGRCCSADGQLWENGDRHHAGEGRPPGFDTVTCARLSCFLNQHTSHILSETHHMRSISSVLP